MKTIVKGFGLSIVVVLTVLIISSVVSKSNRSYENEESLNTAIHQAIKVVKDERYEIATNEQLVAEFNRNLLLQLNSNSKVDIAIYDVDHEYGLIDAEVTLTFQYPHGVEDTVSTRKTILLDSVEIE